MKFRKFARCLAEFGYRVVIVRNDDPLMHEFPETLDDFVEKEPVPEPDYEEAKIRFDAPISVYFSMGAWHLLPYHSARSYCRREFMGQPPAIQPIGSTATCAYCRECLDAALKAGAVSRVAQDQQSP